MPANSSGSQSGYEFKTIFPAPRRDELYFRISPIKAIQLVTRARGLLCSTRRVTRGIFAAWASCSEIKAKTFRRNFFEVWVVLFYSVGHQVGDHEFQHQVRHLLQESGFGSVLLP